MYRARLVLVTSLVLLGLAAIGGLVLLPSYFALKIAAPPLAETTPLETGAPDDALVVERAQFLVREVTGVLGATSSPSATVLSALALKPVGITISRVLYQSDTTGQITISGVGGREAVSAYRDALTKSGTYASVAVPAGALVGSQGGSFSIVLRGAF